MPARRSIPWIGCPQDGEPHIERRYPIRVYPNATGPIFPTMASFLQVRDVSYLPYPIYPILSSTCFRGILWIG